MKILTMVTLPAHLNTLHPPPPLPLPLDLFQEKMKDGIITVVGEEMMIENVGIIGTATAAVHHQLTMKIEEWVCRGEIHHHHVTTIIAIKTAVVGQVIEGVVVEETTVTIEEGTEVTVEGEEVMTKGSNSNIISHQNKIITITVMDEKGKSVSNIIADQHRQDHLEMIPSDTSRVEREPL
jgi:hypothetical protein